MQKLIRASIRRDEKYIDLTIDGNGFKDDYVNLILTPSQAAKIAVALLDCANDISSKPKYKIKIFRFKARHIE